MDDARRSDALLAWSMGTFHAAAFLVLVVGLAHALGGLGGFARLLDTARGFALGGALWVASVAAARWTLRSAGPVLSRAALSGGLVGVTFLWALFGLIALAEGFELVVLFVLAFGSLFAFLVGSVVAGAMAGLTLGLDKWAARVARQGE